MKMGKIIFTAALSFLEQKTFAREEEPSFPAFSVYADGCFSPLSTRLLDIIAPRATPTTRRPQKQATSFAAVIVLAHMILHPAPLSHIAHPTRYLRWLLGKLKAKCISHFSSSRLPVSARLDFPLFCSTFSSAAKQNQCNQSCRRRFLLMTSLPVRWESVHQVSLVVYHISLLVATSTF